MISIFNGRKRTLGVSAKGGIYAQLDVQFRKRISDFTAQGPSVLAVFLCVALHIDADGWAELPGGLKQIAKETGLSEITVSTAIGKLCAMTLDGQRVMLAYQLRKAHQRFTPYRYLVFPTAGEAAMYDTKALSLVNKKTAPQKVGGGSTAPQFTAPGGAAPGGLGGIGITPSGKTLNGKTRQRGSGAGAPPRAAPPAPIDERVAAYKEITGAMPNAVQSGLICAEVRPGDALWRDVLTKRMEYGCSPRNVRAALDDYATGEVIDFGAGQQRRDKKLKRKEPAGLAGLRRAMGDAS